MWPSRSSLSLASANQADELEKQNEDRQQERNQLFESNKRLDKENEQLDSDINYLMSLLEKTEEMENKKGSK